MIARAKMPRSSRMASRTAFFKNCGRRVDILDQVRDDLGVGLGNKLMVRLRSRLSLQVVFDDAVVHHHDASGAIPVR